MITKIEDELNLSLAQEGTVLKNVFIQLSAEAIYYAYLSKQGHDVKETSGGLSNNMTLPVHHRKWASNKGEELYNCKKNKDLQNKNKLFHYLLCEDYMTLKSKYTCEMKEGLYEAIIAGYGPKTMKMDKNQSNHKKFIFKSKETGFSNQKQNEGHSAKNMKLRFRSDHKNNNYDNEDSNIRLTRRNEMYLIWGMAGDYRLMKWKKKREKAEGRYQKYLANRRKRELKKEMAAQNNMRQSMGPYHAVFNSNANQAFRLGMSMKPAKKFLKKKPFAIQKSLGYDYRHCLKKKRNREDDESFYQLYLASITPPLPRSISSASYVVSSAPKFAAPRVLCIGRPKRKKLNVSFDLPDDQDDGDEDDDDGDDDDDNTLENLESTAVLLFQCLALDSASMVWKQHCELNETHYQAAVGMKDKNNIKI